jgi:hypothetical protein
VRREASVSPAVTGGDHGEIVGRSSEAAMRVGFMGRSGMQRRLKDMERIVRHVCCCDWGLQGERRQAAAKIGHVEKSNAAWC